VEAGASRSKEQGMGTRDRGDRSWQQAAGSGAWGDTGVRGSALCSTPVKSLCWRLCRLAQTPAPSGGSQNGQVDLSQRQPPLPARCQGAE